MADEIVVTLLEDVRRAQQAWLDGRLAAEGADQPAGYITIAGPFGLPAVHMTDEMRRGQAAMNANFDGGANAEVDLIESYVSDDLVVLVMVERSDVRFKSRDGSDPWRLRVTSVFRREGDSWRAVHRHADPLVHFRPLDQTLELMVGPGD